MVEPIRKRFNEIIGVVKKTFEDENCGDDIEEIPEEALDNDYPTACFGTSEDEDEPCLLPCDKYGHDKYWCPTNRALSCTQKKKKAKKDKRGAPSAGNDAFLEVQKRRFSGSGSKYSTPIHFV